MENLQAVDKGTQTPRIRDRSGRKKRSLSQRLVTLRNVRRASQVVFFLAFLWLFAHTIYPVKSPVPVDAFLRMSPLIALSTMVSSRLYIAQIVPWAGAILLLTILAGRIFCGWICPLGTLLDLIDKGFAAKRKWRRRYAGIRSFKNLKFYILAFIFVAAVFGVQTAFFFDPIALIVRTFTWVLVAPVQIVVRAVTGSIFLGDHISALPDLVAKDVSWAFPDSQVFFRMNLIVALILGAIIGLNALSSRFWCRNICPLGAFLGIFAKIPLIRKTVSEKCTDCKLCVTDCRMNAIDHNLIKTSPVECVNCYSCIAICPKDAIGVKFGLESPVPIQLSDREPEPQVSLSRRRLIQFAGIGIGWAVLSKTDISQKRSLNGLGMPDDRLIRPPGAKAEEAFMDTCVRCAECMRVCPTGGLQPAVDEAGIEGFWTPVLIPRLGECAPVCTACGEVCPTRSIERFKPEEKYWLFIGQAFIDRSTCIAWAADRRCLVCDEVCTYHAVYWKEVDGQLRPFVNDRKCVGCGICEKNCPIQPIAAIRVSSYGDKRGWTREKQKAWHEAYQNPEQ